MRSIEGLFDNLDVSFPRKLILRVIFLRESVYALFLPVLVIPRGTPIRSRRNLESLVR